VTDCFGFPHNESIVDGKISVVFDVKMTASMFSFHRRVNKKEFIVGWYSTCSDGQFITEYSSLINEFYQLEDQCKNPIHVVIDTSLSSDTMNHKAFICEHMALDSHILSQIFNEIKLDLVFSSGEKLALHHMLHDQVKDDKHKTDINLISVLPSESENLNNSTEALKVLFREIQV
jgi:translation initiation factor 3 subunit F